MYSTTLFQEMEKTGKTKITPREGTYIWGCACAGGTLISTFTVCYFRRKTLLIFGHIAMALTHALIAIFNNKTMDNLMISMVYLYALVYSNSSGPLAWMYATETTIEAAFGTCILVLTGMIFILSLVGPIIMADNSLGPSNTFFIFSGLSLCGAFYVALFFKETKGLTEN